MILALILGRKDRRKIIEEKVGTKCLFDGVIKRNVVYLWAERNRLLLSVMHVALLARLDWHRSGLNWLIYHMYFLYCDIRSGDDDVE